MPRKRKIPREPVSASIHAVSHDGRGIASLDGKTTFVIGALPGETASIQILKSSSQYNEGVAREIQDPNPQRQPAKCPHFTQCGGCRLQHVGQSYQLEIKQKAFQELLAHQAKTEPEQWASPLAADEWHYRRKARLSVRHVQKKNKVLVGFRELNGRFVSDNTTCPILIKPIDSLLPELSTLIERLSIPESIPQIEISAGDEQPALVFRHLEPLTDSDCVALRQFGEAHNLRIMIQSKGYDTIQPLYPADSSLTLSYDLPNHGIRFEFRPQQFIQVNASMNLKMLTQALEWLDLQKTDRVLDLFCGIGNFSLPIAKQAQHVIGVEACESSISQAKHNASINQIDNADFYAADLFEQHVNAVWDQPVDKILLDPPRAGAQAICESMNQFSPKKIVYVSCHTATLARDAKILLDHGYKLTRAGIMDMFPHTQHVEAMALFELENRP